MGGALRQIWGVTGGRDHDDRGYVGRVMRGVVADHGAPDLLIEGGAKGIDKLVGDWARRQCIHTATVSALWDAYDADPKRYQRAAGPDRNRVMADLLRLLASCPGVHVLVVAFPGGRGTASMLNELETRNLPVFFAPEPNPRPIPDAPPMVDPDA